MAKLMIGTRFRNSAALAGPILRTPSFHASTATTAPMAKM